MVDAILGIHPLVEEVGRGSEPQDRMDQQDRTQVNGGELRKNECGASINTALTFAFGS